MEETFFVIKCTDDGMTFEGPLARDVLEKRLTESYYGANKRFVNKIPRTDGHCLLMGDDELLIISGHIVTPLPMSVVTRWKL